MVCYTCLLLLIVRYKAYQYGTSQSRNYQQAGFTRSSLI